MSEIRKPNATKYLAYTETDGEFEFFDDYDKAKKWLEEGLIDSNGYMQESPENCGIYRLDTGIEITVLANRDDYTKEEWDEKTSHGDDGEDYSEMWKHTFVKME